MSELTMSFDRVIADVRAERVRQDGLWGADRDLHPAIWHLILSEEIGEVATATQDLLDTAPDAYYCRTQFRHLRAELTHVAAVAVAWIEAIDREAS